ncbi:MAG: dephospho-CoA kinase [Verrucomicrobia bacterium]|nr:dephospho-CoA kinase [Verrucomicrobiota bacterium]
MKIGLTGGIGCGKSTAARFFAEAGFRRIDTDELIKNEVLLQPEVVVAITQHFGPQTLTNGGQVDRAAVAKIVFSDEVALRWLEDLLHPRLFGILRTRLTEAPSEDYVVEVPLLFEKHLENWFDLTVCVATTSHLQIARLEERGLPKALAEQRISKQLPLAHKLELADYVLLNDGSPDFLRDQINRLAAQLRARR